MCVYKCSACQEKDEEFFAILRPFFVAHGKCVFSFLVVDANPTVILERSEGSKSEMRVTVLFLPALILRSAKASLKNDSGVGAVQKTILREALL